MQLEEVNQRSDMVAHLLSDLSTSGDRNKALLSLRQIKNQIIGNKAKKTCFVKAGAVPLVVALLHQQLQLLRQPRGDEEEASRITEALTQSAAALGSFACGNPIGLGQVIQSGGLEGLATTLSHSEDRRVNEAGMRALKLVYAQQVWLASLPPQIGFGLSGRQCCLCESLHGRIDE